MSFWSSCLDQAPLLVPSLSQQGFLIVVWLSQLSLYVRSGVMVDKTQITMKLREGEGERERI